MEYIDIINYISDKIILKLMVENTSITSKINIPSRGNVSSNINEEYVSNRCKDYIINIFPIFFNDKKELNEDIKEFYNDFEKKRNELKGGSFYEGGDDESGDDESGDDKKKVPAPKITRLVKSLELDKTAQGYGIFSDSNGIKQFDEIFSHFMTGKKMLFTPLQIIMTCIYGLLITCLVHKYIFSSKQINKYYDYIVNKSGGIFKCFIYLNLIYFIYTLITRLITKPSSEVESISTTFLLSVFETTMVSIFTPIITFCQIFHLENIVFFLINSFNQMFKQIFYEKKEKEKKEKEMITSRSHYSHSEMGGGGNSSLLTNNSFLNDFKEAFLYPINWFKENMNKLAENNYGIDYIFSLFEKEISKNTGKFKYEFDINTGLIICVSKPKYAQKEIQLSLSPNIIIKTNEDNTINYLINDITLDSKTTSLIEGRPIHTALLIAYIYNKKDKEIKENVQYKYYLNPNGNVEIFDINTNQEVSSVKLYLKSEKETEKEKTCKEIFGEEYNTENCSKHFFNIIGRAGLGLLENLNESNTGLMTNRLLEANPAIQYEILKTLDWKIKYDNNKKYLITVKEWLDIEKNNLYKDYLNNNLQLTNLLDAIVNKINNTPFLYPEVVDKPIIKKLKKRLK